MALLEVKRPVLSWFTTVIGMIGRARARHLLVACGLLIGLTLACSAVLVFIQLRHDDVDDSERELKNLALTIADQVDSSLQGVDLLQLGLIGHMRELGITSPESFENEMKTFEVHQDLGRRIAGLSHIRALSLHDRNGQLINFSRAWPAPDIDVRDRDFIRELLAPNAPESFISAPVQSKTTGEWTIYRSRRFESADGKLIGIVLATIETAYFEQIFSRISLGDGGSFTLYRHDGMLLARYPHADPKIGQSYAATSNFKRLLAALDQGSVRLISLYDGHERMIAPHSVAHYPLLISVTNTMDAILADSRRQAVIIVSAVLLMELVIAGIVALGVRHLHSYEALEAANTAQLKAEAAQAAAMSQLQLAHEHEQAARTMHAQSVRFDTALSNMMQGLLMFDHADRLLVVNRRLSKLFRVPDGEITPGMSHDDVMERVVAAGCVTADEMREICKRGATLLSRKEPAKLTWELSNGRAFAVAHQPMEEGWLNTYEEITERRHAEARIAHLAHHDALTDLPNRVLFRERLEQAIVQTRRGQGLALLCLDLDQFKAVNDTLGHPIGDALLQAVGARLLECTRETDTVARLGGDEFAIVQAPIDRPIDATIFAERLIELLEEPFEIAGHHIVIGTSIGIAYAPQDGLDPDQLLKCADLALYRAKGDGRSVYRLFHAGMDAQMQARRILELSLRHALKAGQFELFYQPFIDLQDRTVSGFEALLRWRHPDTGIIPPNEFIPVAEETGLIVPIGEWVLRRACAAAASWAGEMRVAVNLSPVQFRSRDLVATVASALRDAGLAPDRLELEITETVMLQDTDATLATLHHLQGLGVRIAMDDFGTGYSSLSYLRRFPFDRIKIDQSFVHDMCSKQDCGAIVRAVAGLSNELGMATTAEGVETTDQLDAITLAGCTEVQGYLFSPAVPEGAVPDLLRRIAEMLPERGARAVPEYAA
jgi:diguanylate cyclase (GGDEF)-like protein